MTGSIRAPGRLSVGIAAGSTSLMATAFPFAALLAGTVVILLFALAFVAALSRRGYRRDSAYRALELFLRPGGREDGCSCAEPPPGDPR